MHPIRKILVPLDFSAHSASAFEYALDLARRYSAKLELVHVFDVSIYSLPDGTPMLGQQQYDQIVSGLEHRMDDAKRDALAAGLTAVEAKMIQGKPELELVRIAREDSADLIVMGTHGRTGLRHLWLGSVAEHLVRRAPCPVFIVKAQPAFEPATARAS